MTLETQYRLYVENNPKNSHWTFVEWLKWHSDNLAKTIEEIDPKVSDNFQIGPDGAFEYEESDWIELDEDFEWSDDEEYTEDED
jgi:hypothetical protein